MVTPAFAGCVVIRATHSAATPAEAVKEAQALAVQQSLIIKHNHHWRYVTLRARKVTPDPFWKMVRPVVPKDILIKPDVVTRKTYTQCWPGVVVPYVCTAGAVACGR